MINHKTEDKPKQSKKLGLLSITLIILTVVTLPFLALNPFRVHSKQLAAVIAFPAMSETKAIGCINGVKSSEGYNPVAVNQCADWQYPASLHKVTIITFLCLAGFSLSTTVYAYTRKHQQVKRIIPVWAVSTLASVAGTIIAYTVMRMHSQSHGFVVANQLANGEYAVAHPVAFGYGISPFVLVLMLIVYLAPPLFSWYMLSFRHSHPNKKALFQ